MAIEYDNQSVWKINKLWGWKVWQGGDMLRATGEEILWASRVIYTSTQMQPQIILSWKGSQGPWSPTLKWMACARTRPTTLASSAPCSEWLAAAPPPCTCCQADISDTSDICLPVRVHLWFHGCCPVLPPSQACLLLLLVRQGQHHEHMGAEAAGPPHTVQHTQRFACREKLFLFL